MDWLETYRMGTSLTKNSSDDETSGSKFKDFFDSLKGNIDEYGDDDEEGYVSELRKKYEEFSYQFALDPIHVGVYAVNIVCDTLSLLGKALGLMVENMTTPWPSRESSYDNDSSGESNGYSEGWSEEKSKKRAKDKGDQEKGKGSMNKGSKVKDDAGHPERDAEKRGRQARAAQIAETSRQTERYEARRRRAMSAQEMGGLEQSNERSFSRY